MKDIYIGYFQPVYSDEFIQNAPKFQESFYAVWVKPYEHLPKWSDWVDTKWDNAERNKIIRYLNRLAMVTNYDVRCLFYKGSADCRCCGDSVGSREYTIKYTKNQRFIVPEGFQHYVGIHDVKPPQEFIDFVLTKI